MTTPDVQPVMTQLPMQTAVSVERYRPNPSTPWSTDWAYRTNGNKLHDPEVLFYHIKGDCTEAGAQTGNRFYTTGVKDGRGPFSLVANENGTVLCPTCPAQCQGFKNLCAEKGWDPKKPMTATVASDQNLNDHQRFENITLMNITGSAPLPPVENKSQLVGFQPYKPLHK